MRIHDADAFEKLLAAIRDRGWTDFTADDDRAQVTALALPPWHCWPSWADTAQPAADEPVNTSFYKTWRTAHRMRLALERMAHRSET